MAVSRDAVIWGFRLVLGREPESEEGIQAHCRLADEAALIEVLLRSPEFQASGRLANVVSVKPGKPKSRSKAWAHRSTSSQRMAVFGNCQVSSVARLLQAMTGDASVRSFETTPHMLARVKSGELDLGEVLRESDLVFVQLVSEITEFVRQRFPAHAHKLRQFPPVAYAGFHPDSVYVRAGASHLSGCMGEYHSALALWAWRAGLGVDAAVDLFRNEVFESLHYRSYAMTSHAALVEVGRAAGFPMSSFLDSWRARGCWMHTVNHPRIDVLADLVRAMLVREGIEPIPAVETNVEDPLQLWPVWPLYPELAGPLGLTGSYSFKIDRGFCPPGQPVLALDLPAFVEASFNTYRRHTGAPLECPRIDLAPYAALTRFVREKPSRLRSVMSAVARALGPAEVETPAVKAPPSPYEGLPDTAFWRRAVARVPEGALDPVVQPGFRIDRSHRVATAGSCFAQHIARTLQRDGFNYFVVDDEPALDAAARAERGIGVFSARYGNLYTARQLVQLFDRAFGELHPADTAWQRPDGRFVDPFRPQIEAAGFADAAAVAEAAREHLGHVRRLFHELDVFVFTLGLTEAWRHREDGLVVPLAPGVVASSPRPDSHEFVNFGVEEVERDLRGFVARLRAINERSRIILTVSPVPLIATYEPQHVLVATTYSKSVLRAAAGAVARDLHGVDYFPSYEIITSAHARSRYFEDDLRSVTEEGVANVMRVFRTHYTAGDPTVPAPAPALPAVAAAIQAEQRALGAIVCDEEAIDRHRP